MLSNILYAQTANIEKVSLQLQWKYQFQFAGFIMAKEKGFYHDANLDVTIKEWQQNIDMVDEVVNQNATYSVARPSTLIDISNGKDILLLAVIYQSSPLVLLTTEHSNIKSIKDFKNKNVMTTGDLNSDSSLLSMIFSQGIKSEDLNIQNPSFNVRDLINKKTDLMASYISNEPFLLREIGIEPVIFNPKDYGFDFYNDILITSSEHEKNNPKQVQEFVQASLHGWEYAFNNIDESVDIIFEKYNTQNKTKKALLYEAQELKKLAFHKTKQLGKIEESKLEKIYDIYKLLGLTSHNIDFKKIIYSNDPNTTPLTQEEKKWIATNTVKVGVSSWYPFYFYNEDKSEIIGVSVDFIIAVAKKLNLEIEFVPKIWTELLSDFKAHKIDVLPATFFTKERTVFGDYTQKYLDVKEHIYVKENSTINDFSELKNKKLVMMRSYGTISKIAEKYPTIKIIEVDTIEETIKMVLNGEADALFNSKFWVDNFLKDNYIYGLKSLYQTDFKPSALHFFSNKEKPILNSILKKGLHSLSFEEKNKIVSNWSLPTYDRQVERTSLLLTRDQKEYLKNRTVIRMCNNTGWAPIEFIEDGNLKGIAPDTMKLIEKKLNIKFERVFTQSWSQSQSFLKSKKCDILSSAIKNSKREKFALFTKPYLSYKLGLITRNDKPFIESIDDVIDQPMARKKGSGLIQKMKDEYDNINIIQTQNAFDTLQHIISGDAYYTIEALPVASYYFNKYALNDLQIAGYTNMRYQIRIAVRDDEPILRDILNKVLSTITKKEKNEIYNKWVNFSINEAFNKKIILYIAGVIGFIVFIFIYKQYMLRKSLKEFDELINATMEGIIVFKDGVIIDTNKSTLKILGYKIKEELIGKKLLGFIARESKETIRKSIQSRDVEAHEALLLKEDDSVFQALVRIFDLKNRNVNILSIIDISILKQQEKLLIEQSRMVALGEMIGNIAHQWRQPLSVISTGATGMLLEKEYGNLSDKSFKEICDSINKNAQYLSRTIDDFKDFIKGDGHKTSFTLSSEIFSFLSLIDGSIKRHEINIILKTDDSISLDGYPNELIQCLMNIYNNAKDALIDKDIESRYIFIETFLKEKKVVILFRDNADGIDEKVIDKIFDPYFTTKHQSKGTGIGLSMTYNLIVEGMKGTINAKNILYKYNGIQYKGAQFVIELPL
jgi:PAS domain S-box-containing protein